MARLNWLPTLPQARKKAVPPRATAQVAASVAAVSANPALRVRAKKPHLHQQAGKRTVSSLPRDAGRAGGREGCPGIVSLVPAAPTDTQCTLCHGSTHPFLKEPTASGQRQNERRDSPHQKPQGRKVRQSRCTGLPMLKGSAPHKPRLELTTQFSKSTNIFQRNVTTEKNQIPQSPERSRQR